MAPKIKIEDTTGSGEKITLTIEGSEISEQRLLQVLQMLRLLKSSGGGVVEEGESMKERIWRVIVENFGDGTWFSIRDLYNVASREMPDLKVTAVSTYVSRLVGEGRLVKRGSKPNTRYRVQSVRREAAYP
jgi:hypothetical protein